MINIVIDEKLKELWPKTTLGIIEGTVSVQESSEDLLKQINDFCNELMMKMKVEDIVSNNNIKNGREAYKSFGKSPSKYRLSSEALFRRVLKGKGLYRVNNIVDINNLISIKTGFPVGSYDKSKIDSNIKLHIAEDGQTYKGIGKEVLNIEHLPVLCDSQGDFGSTTSDSERAMIGDSAKNIIMCIYSFCGEEELIQCLNEAKELLEKYAEGKNITFKIVK